MNTDLIAQLEKLSPTDRLVSLESLAHDVKLEQLAPTMRIEILDMAKRKNDSKFTIRHLTPQP